MKPIRSKRGAMFYDIVLEKNWLIGSGMMSNRKAFYALLTGGICESLFTII